MHEMRAATRCGVPLLSANAWRRPAGQIPPRACSRTHGAWLVPHARRHLYRRAMLGRVRGTRTGAHDHLRDAIPPRSTNCAGHARGYVSAAVSAASAGEDHHHVQEGTGRPPSANRARRAPQRPSTARSRLKRESGAASGDGRGRVWRRGGARASPACSRGPAAAVRPNDGAMVASEGDGGGSPRSALVVVGSRSAGGAAPRKGIGGQIVTAPSAAAHRPPPRETAGYRIQGSPLARSPGIQCFQ
jgi:hypothetical protein